MRTTGVNVTPVSLVFLRLAGSLALLLGMTSCAEGPADNASNVERRLCQHILRNREKMIVDTSQTEIVWSDGAMLELGTNFPKGLQALIDRPSAQENIRAFVKTLDAGNSSTWRKASLGPVSRRDRYVTVVSPDGEIQARVEKLYLEYLAERYPSSSMRIRGQYQPIIFLVNGEVQAAVMPVKR